MGFIQDSRDKIQSRGDDFSGRTGAEASLAGAELQTDVSREGIQAQKDALAQLRGDLNPFRQAGTNQLSQLTSLINDPNAQKDFIQNNPFFNAIADRAKSDVFANQAARGKLGSGGTAEALQNSLLTQGNQLLQQNISNGFQLAGIGQNSAALSGQGAQNAGNAITDLLTGIGNAGAAGGVGAANALGQGASNVVTGLAAFLCDRRFKTDLNRIGKFVSRRGFEYVSYLFKYVGSDEWVHGLISQEVEKINPAAVADIYGVKYVLPGEL